MQYLHERGIKTAFMVPGGGSIKLCTALFESRIETMEQHDEQACGLAAEAAARYTGLPGVVMVTSGPGATNAFTAVAEAYFNSSPVLFLSGQVTINQTIGHQAAKGIRQIGVQEIDIVASVKPITKYAAMIKDPQLIKAELDQAWTTALSGRPGPVWLDIPVDVQGAVIDESSLSGYAEEPLTYKAEDADIAYVVAQLKAAERPVVLIGQGVRNAGAEALVEELITRYDFPLVSSYLGLDIISRDLPNNMRNIGLKGCRYGNITVQDADFLLALGSRLSIATVGYNSHTFARGAKIVAVDVDEAEHQKNTVDLKRFIQCDAKVFLEKLLPALNQAKISPHSNWLRHCIKIKEKYPVCRTEFRKNDGRGINPYDLIDCLTTAIPAETPIIADTGTALFATSQGANLKRAQRYIPSGFATMGYSMPAAIGVCVALGQKPVVAFTGDGSVQMNLQELQTLVHYRLPVKLVVLNNNGYYTMKPPVKRGYNAEGTYAAIKAHISFPSFEKLAAAYGITYVPIRTHEELACVAASKALHTDQPVIFDVFIDETADVYTLTTVHMQDGSIVSRPIEDMYPYIEHDELYGMMHIKSIE